MDRYSIDIAWSEEDGGYIATVPEFPGLSAFGETWEEAAGQAREALRGFIDTYREDGLPLPEQQEKARFSGQLRLRMPASLHARLAQRAEREGVSLNQLLVSLLSEAYGFREGNEARFGSEPNRNESARTDALP
jgi:antitoxin HicB